MVDLATKLRLDMIATYSNIMAVELIYMDRLLTQEINILDRYPTALISIHYPPMALVEEPRIG